MSKKTLLVGDIIEIYLAENGFDGLVSDDCECACKLGELFPCGNVYQDCCPGYKTACDCGDHDYHISTTKMSEERS